MMTNKKSKFKAIVSAFILALLMMSVAAFMTACGSECKHKNMENHPAIVATCTQNGNSEYWTCPDCNKIFADEAGTEELPAVPEIAKTEHEWETAYRNDDEGHWHKCKNCDAVSSTDPHAVAAIGEAKEASCTEDGVTAGKKCSVCDYIIEEQRTLPKSDHNLVRTEAQRATCSDTGNIEYWYCDRCEEYFREEAALNKIEQSETVVSVDPTAHKFGELQAKVDATCTTPGTKAHKDCEFCRKHFDENGTEITDLTIAVDPTAHKFGELQAKVDATCTTSGTKAHKDCEFCWKYFDENGTEITDLTIVALGHSYSEIVVAEQPEKLTYFVGEDFNTQGMSVTSTCTRDHCDTTITVSDYTLSENTALEKGERQVTITWNDGVKDLTTTISVKVYEKHDFSSQGSYADFVYADSGDLTATITPLNGNCSLLVCNGVEYVNGAVISDSTMTLKESTVNGILGDKTYGDFALALSTDTYDTYEMKIAVVTAMIDSAEDLTAITNANKDTKIVDAYYIVTADIDASAAGITVSGKAGAQTWTADHVVRFVGGDYSMSEGGFVGVFDGRGHVISNLNTFAYKYQGTGGLFGQLNSGSQVKNVAFTDVVINGRFGAMLVGESCGFNGLLENVAITVKGENIVPYTGQTKDYTKILWKLSGGEINNCLFVGVEQIAFDTETTTITNVMSVTTSENEAVKNNGGFNASGTKYNAQPNYASVNAMLSALNSENVLQDWSDITYNNDAIYYGERVVVLPELIVESSINGNEVSRGETVTFTTDGYAALSLKETVAGVTLENGELTIGEAEEGTQIVVVATSTLNASVTKELFTYMVIRNYTETALTGTYDLSLENETSSVTPSQAIEGSIEKVKTANTDVTEGVTFADGKLTFTKTALQSLLGGKAYAEGVEIEIYTSADKKYTATVNVATMLIDSAEDLTTITNANTAATIDAYYIVTADIDASTAGITVNCTGNGQTYNNVVRFVNNDTQSSTTAGFAGIFDGRGHVISNINSYAYAYNGLGGLFGQLLSGSQVKNVAFTNVTAVGRYGTILVGESKKFYGTLENVVITVKEIHLQGNGAHTCAYIVADLSGGTFRNCLFIGVGTNSTSGSSGSATNVMTVASVRQDTGGFSWTGNAAYNAQPVYASVDAMLTALATDNKLQNWGDITYNAENNAVYFGAAVVVQTTAE